MTSGRDDFCNAVHVSRETMERLDIYAGLIGKWTRRINLISPKTLPDLWTRHFLDSAQMFQFAPENCRTWVDIGSGGGFPGAVVAIMAGDRFDVTLIEADQRKAAFLRTVARETGVPFKVLSQRIEVAEPQNANVVSARALAPVGKLLDYVDRHLAAGGVALLQKGVSWQEELSTALETWRFRWEKHQSTTDADAVILELGDIERV